MAYVLYPATPASAQEDIMQSLVAISAALASILALPV